MIDERTRFECEQWLREKRKNLKTRRAYCLLLLMNYMNGLLLIYSIFRYSPYSLLMDFFFCVSSTCLGMAATALYVGRPFWMIPDVIYKMCLAAVALFDALRAMDAWEDYCGWRFGWVLLSLASQTLEVQILLKASFGMRLELNRLMENPPPPPYNQLLSMFAANGGRAAATNADPAQATSGDAQSVGCESLKVDEEKEEEEKKGETAHAATTREENPGERPETPPPTYEEALRRVAHLREDVVISVESLEEEQEQAGPSQRDS